MNTLTRKTAYLIYLRTPQGSCFGTFLCNPLLGSFPSLFIFTYNNKHIHFFSSEKNNQNFV